MGEAGRAVDAVASRENAPRRPLGDLFVSSGLLGRAEVDRALHQGAQTGERLGEVVVRLGLASEDDVARLLAEQWGLAHVERSSIWFDADALSSLSREEAQRLEALPTRVEDGRIVVAVAEPTEGRLGALREVIGEDIIVVVIPKSALDAGLRSDLLRSSAVRASDSHSPAEAPTPWREEAPSPAPPARPPAAAPAPSLVALPGGLDDERVVELTEALQAAAAAAEEDRRRFEAGTGRLQSALEHANAQHAEAIARVVDLEQALERERAQNDAAIAPEALGEAQAHYAEAVARIETLEQALENERAQRLAVLEQVGRVTAALRSVRVATEDSFDASPSGLESP